MSIQVLTPYDTGDRLEPHPWVPGRGGAAPSGLPRQTVEDDYGRVDFEDDESRTVVSLYVGRDDEGSYALRVENLSDQALTVAGDIVSIVIGPEHLAGLQELLALAERGRDDFLRQAEHSDYSDDDQADATLRWVTAHNAAVALRHQLH